MSEGELQKRMFIDIIQEYEQWAEKYPIADRAIIRNHVVEALERGFKIVDEAKKDFPRDSLSTHNWIAEVKKWKAKWFGDSS